MTSDTLNNPPIDSSNGVVDAFLRVLTENTRASGIVESELKHITKVLEAQQATLLEVTRELTAIRVEFAATGRDVKELKAQFNDHEQRLRESASKLAVVEQFRERIREVETDVAANKAAQATKNQEQDEKLHLFDKQQTRILAVAGVLMIVFQTVLSLFVQPIVEKALF